jgi:hypothetical protein
MIINPYFFEQPLLLDLYPNAATAYSVRKLRTAYTGNCIRVRRSSDNAEQNIGFVNNELDTTSLLSFVGAGNGFVTTWYDQSGNNNNGIQTTAANQPQIVNAGSLLIENTKPRLAFDGTNDSFNITNIVYNTTHYQSFVGKRDASGRRLLALASTTNAYLFTLWINNIYLLQGNNTNYQASSLPDFSTNQVLLTGLRTVSGMQMYKNNSVISSINVSSPIGNNINTIGNYASNTNFGSLQEIIFYNNDQSSNRISIESNINSYFNIYP